MNKLTKAARGIACSVFHRHKFIVLGRPTEWSQHVGCKHCGREWGLSWSSGRDHMLRWHHVASFYAERGYVRAALANKAENKE